MQIAQFQLGDLLQRVDGSLWLVDMINYQNSSYHLTRSVGGIPTNVILIISFKEERFYKKYEPLL